MTLAESFFQAISTGLGANIMVFGFAVVFLAGLFIVTRQSLASSILLAFIALDGLERVANEPIISLLYLFAKIIAAGLIALAFITTVFKK